MATGNYPANNAARMIVSLLPALCAGLVACASSQPVQAAKADFSGVWSVKLCDERNPKLQCGSFDLYLIQNGNRICGDHFVATPGLSRLDEGDPGSVLGTFHKKKATLVVNNSRANSKYLATAELISSGLRWHVVGTVIPGERPWDSVVPTQILLKRNEQTYAKEQWQELKDTPCRWPDELSDET